MNHRRSHTVKKIGKDYKHKKAILKSLSCDVIRHEKISTTKPKAKLLRSFLEKIIHRSKVDSLHNRREVYKKIRNTKLLTKLFENIGKRYQNRNGGYLRIVKAGQRKGDAADICYVMLTEEILSNQNDNNDVKVDSSKSSADSKEKSKTVDSKSPDLQSSKNKEKASKGKEEKKSATKKDSSLKKQDKNKQDVKVKAEKKAKKPKGDKEEVAKKSENKTKNDTEKKAGKESEK